MMTGRLEWVAAIAAEDRFGARSLDEGGRSTDPADQGDEAWRVFVLLHRRPGVFEREIRASGPLAAQNLVEAADRDVLATLGAQAIRGRAGSAAMRSDYRAMQPAGRRFMSVRRAPSAGSGGRSAVPAVVVLAPKDLSPRP